MIAAYDPHTIEPLRQAGWRRTKAYCAPAPMGGVRDVYIKAASPFTSGNLHMGHARSYALADAYARFCRANGDAVLFSIGFDAFGLPAELKSIAEQVSTPVWVRRCYRAMLRQFERLGLSFDWDRVFLSCDPELYQWSQWLFLALLEHDLVYRETGPVDWCARCQTTLASLQVEDGRCARCSATTTIVRRPQWYLRYSRYVEENEARLRELDLWDKATIAAQSALLGRVDGLEFDVLAPDGALLPVFTPYAPELVRGSFVMVSPRSAELDRWVTSSTVARQVDRLPSAGIVREGRSAQAIAAVDTGLEVEVAGSGLRLPVLITSATDRFGATVALGAPTRDRTDAVLSRRLGLAGMWSNEGTRQAAPAVRPAVRYRSHDFSIGRQRSWGAPIPVIHCERCGLVPVPREALPVRLPGELAPDGAGQLRGLQELQDFVNTDCPRCLGAAKRETETLDCHFDAMWMWAPSCVPAGDRAHAMFTHPELARWLPGEQMIIGIDGGGYVFDQRITAKALRDVGALAHLRDGEPFRKTLMHGMVILDGRKMSKHLGNTIDLEALVREFGADAVRLAVLSAARPGKSFSWDERVISARYRWLEKLWDYAGGKLAAVQGEDRDPVIDDLDPLRRRLTRWCSAATLHTTAQLEGMETHRAFGNIATLLDRIKEFERRALERRRCLEPADLRAIVDALALLAQLLTPLAPHVGEELWQAAAEAPADLPPPWPSAPGSATSRASAPGRNVSPAARARRRRVRRGSPAR